MTHPITRRTALRFALGAAAPLFTPFAFRRSHAAPAGPALPIPGLLEPDASGTIALRMAKGRHSFTPGQAIASAGINGAFLGPLVRVNRGSAVTFAVENAMDEITTLHWHGLFVPSDNDGGPHSAIAPGETWLPQIRIDQPPALTWFHPHVHGGTARQAHLGLAGLLLVTDGGDRERGLPSRHGVDDLPLILQDRRVLDGETPYAPDMMDIIHGFRGTHIAVNGAIGPVAPVPAGLVRLRFLNAANARNFHLRFSDGRPMHVIASDGGYLAKPAETALLTIAPGERYEMLADFSDGAPVSLVTLPDDNGRFGTGMMDRMKAVASSLAADEAHVMAFAPAEGLSAEIRRLPDALDDPGTADPAKAAQRREFLFDERLMQNMAAMMGGGQMGGGMMGGQMSGMDHSAHAGRPSGQTGPAVSAMTSGIAMAIAGAPFDMGRIDVEAKLGTEEIWTLSTQDMAHPFHIHGASFRVLTKNGKAPVSHETGWKDTSLISGKAELLVRFNRPASKDKPFMFHCHILEHEDAGMMGQFITV